MSMQFDSALQSNLASYARLCAEAGWPVKLDELPQALERIVEFYQPVKLFAFGSLVRGDFDAHSDLDLMIVVPDDAAQEQRTALKAYAFKSGTRFPMDIVVVRNQDFEWRCQAVTLLDRTVKREGRLLYAA